MGGKRKREKDRGKEWRKRKGEDRMETGDISPEEDMAKGHPHAIKQKNIIAHWANNFSSRELVGYRLHHYSCVNEERINMKYEKEDEHVNCGCS